MVKSYTEYEEHVNVNRDDWNRWCGLLDIDELDSRKGKSAAKKLGGKPDDRIPVCSVRFPDGAAVDFELVSGQHNYWVSAALKTADGRLLESEPDFDLDTRLCVTDEEAHMLYSTVIGLKD